MGSQRVKHNWETNFHFSPLLSEINICSSGEAGSLISEIICPDITGLLRGTTGIKIEFCMIKSSCVSYYTFKVYALSLLSLPGIKLIKDSRQQSKSLIPTIDKCLPLATLAWSQLIPKKNHMTASFKNFICSQALEVLFFLFATELCGRVSLSLISPGHLPDGFTVN